MLEETLVQETAQDAGQGITLSEGAMPLEEVLWLIEQLGKAGFLKEDTILPEEWTLWSEVAENELVSLLREHLSKAGWRRVVEAMHQHNRRTSGRLWDMSQPADLIAAVQEALARWESASVAEGRAPDVGRLLSSLMGSAFGPAGITDWQLSPRVWIKRLSARARRAHIETQIESAAREAALQTARMVGMDAERDVALKRVERLREKLAEQLQVFCEENGLPLPQPYSREEAYCLHLLNAYFVALAEAEGAISQRGAALARRQIDLEGERAEVRMDGRLLPGLVAGRREINPLRESLFRERMRHWLALLVSGFLGALWGVLWGVVESLTDLLIAAIARYAVVVAPALLVGLLTLIAQTVAYSGALTLSVVVEFLLRALWNGALALGTTIIVYGCWLYYATRRRRLEAGSSSDDMRPTKRSQTGLEP